jgi:hypothetical protein
MILCKETVRFSILRDAIWTIFPKVDQVFKSHGIQCILTCGTEAHPDDDPHTKGFAIDLRSKHITDDDIKHRVFDALKQTLGALYTVILENEGQDQEHYHIQIRKDLWRNLV